MLAEHRAQGRMQKMRRRVVERGRAAALTVHVRSQRVAERDASGQKLAQVRMRGAAFLGVVDSEIHAGRVQLACVTDLAAGLGIKRRAIKDYLAVITGLQRL